jgi:hypothetical protein
VVSNCSNNYEPNQFPEKPIPRSRGSAARGERTLPENAEMLIRSGLIFGWAGKQPSIIYGSCSKG